MKTVKDIILDFINYLFLLGLGIFCLTYYVFGNYLSFFTEYIKMFVPLALFGVIFLIKIKSRRAIIHRMREEGGPGEEEECLITEIERRRDKYVICSLPVVILAIALFNHSTNLIDFIQALTIFLIMYFWHRILLGRKAKFYLSSEEKIKDEFVIFALPIFIIALALLGKSVTLVDFSQAVVIFLIMYFWHKILFKGGG